MIDPLTSLSAVRSSLGPEAAISLGEEARISEPAPQSDGGFGRLLSDQISQLNEVQATAESQAQALATGKATDVSEVVLAAERAQLSMQLATGMRNQVVSAYNELLRTQL